MTSRRLAAVAPAVGAALVLAAVATAALGLVVANGVCCADDAYHAVIAKNLAYGLGYVSTVQDEQVTYVLKPFDPHVGSGPALIVPAALLIAVVGNAAWAPGTAAVLLWTSVCWLIGRRAFNLARGPGFAAACALFCYLCVALTPYHFEQWVALLGEVPAGLLLVLGVLVLSSGDRPVDAFTAGVCFALAALTKLVALLPVGTAMSVFAVHAGWTSYRLYGRVTRTAVARTACLVLGLLLPHLVFEAWKLIALGPGAHATQWREYAAYVLDYGLRPEVATTFAERYAKSAAAVAERFAVSLPALLALTGAAGALVWRDAPLRRIYLTLELMVLVYIAWWCFFSTGWPRYLLIGLIVATAVLVLPFLAARPRVWLVPYVVVLVLWPHDGWGRWRYPLKASGGQFFARSARAQALIEASAAIADQRGSDVAMTQWWATAADLEYLSAAPLAFTSFRDPAVSSRPGRLVVVNTRFVVDDPEFKALRDRCVTVKDLGHYWIGRTP